MPDVFPRLAGSACQCRELCLGDPEQRCDRLRLERDRGCDRVVVEAKQREAELVREARLQVGVATRPRRTLREGVTSTILIALAVGALAVGAAAANPSAAPAGDALEPRSLARAKTIRAQLDARYRVLPSRRRLAVTEATSTGVVESFTLLTPDLLGARFLPADNGIWYAICPVRATCPYPARRFARPAADLLPRRLALELALRTFLETSADVVAVSLPTPRFIAFIVERKELAREVDLPTLAKALGRNPSRALTVSLQGVVERVTRPRVFLFLALEPTRSGRDSWGAMPLWPSLTG